MLLQLWLWENRFCIIQGVRVKSHPDLDFILLFVFAANVENSPVEDETNWKLTANVRPISSSSCVQDYRKCQKNM